MQGYYGDCNLSSDKNAEAPVCNVTVGTVPPGRLNTVDSQAPASDQGQLPSSILMTGLSTLQPQCMQREEIANGLGHCLPGLSVFVSGFRAIG